MTTLGEIGTLSLGAIGDRRLNAVLPPDPVQMVYGPPMNREPMRRRAVRIIVTCVSDSPLHTAHDDKYPGNRLNSVTHGMAHAADDILYCATCSEQLPKADVRLARLGRRHPFNAR